MNEEELVTRRRMLKTAVVGASGVAAGTLLQTARGATTPKAAAAQVPVKQRCPDAPRVRGPFPILSTPFTTSGDVDFEVLARRNQSYLGAERQSLEQYCAHPEIDAARVSEQCQLAARHPEVDDGKEALPR